MRISDWSSDVCSSDLIELMPPAHQFLPDALGCLERQLALRSEVAHHGLEEVIDAAPFQHEAAVHECLADGELGVEDDPPWGQGPVQPHHNRTVIRRSEEHTSELQSLMRISYAVFC